MTLASIHRHNQTVLNSLEEGDLVEFPRAKGIFSHWAVYVGNQEVVHLSGNSEALSKDKANLSHIFTICGVEFSKAKVKRENFFIVADKSKAKKNNDKDNKASPFDKQTIVRRALSKIGDIRYNILWKNCEYLASWCRYREGWSEQTNTAVKVAGVAAAIVGAIVIFCKIINRDEED